MVMPAFLVVLVALPAVAAAQTVAIEHQPIGCVVAEQFPIIPARLDPPENVARARVMFRAADGPDWYHVEMRPSEGAFAAILPKPKKDTRAIHYYIESVATGFATARSPEQVARVVASAALCRSGTIAATAAGTTSVTVAAPAGSPALPAGFSFVGISAAVAVPAAGAAAAAASGGMSTWLIVGGVAGLAATGAAVALATGAVGDGGSFGLGGNDAKAQVSGHVFGNCDAPNTGGPCRSMNPVAGAVISTSLDSTTATTDGSGFFHLRTNTAVGQDACYTLTITAGGFPSYNVQGTWGNNNVNRTFFLSPPIPSLPGPPCTTH